MATITDEVREALVRIYVGMFNASPGAEGLSSAVALYDETATRTAIANERLTAEMLAEIYPGIAQSLIGAMLDSSQFSSLESDGQKIAQVLSNFGIDSDSDAYDKAFDFFQSGLDSGIPPGHLLHEAAYFLSTTEEENFSKGAATFRNKVEVSIVHSMELGLSSDSLEERQAVIADVTDDPQSVTDAIQALKQQAEEEGSGAASGSSSFSYALVDSSNDTIPAAEEILLVGVNDMASGDFFAAA